MRERVSLLEAEISKREATIKQLREAADAAAGSSKVAAEAAPADPAKAKQSYLSAVENAKEVFAKTVGKEASIDRVSVFPVTGPDPDFPITSKVGFSITTRQGGKMEVIVPMKASATGEWSELESGAISQALRQGAADAAAGMAARAPQAPANRPSPPQETKQSPADVLGANRTVEVGWGDEPARQAPRQPAQQQAPQTSPQPAQPKPQPVKPMPSDRDVIIDFGQ